MPVDKTIRPQQVQPKKGVGRKPRYKLYQDPRSQLWVLAWLETTGGFQIPLEEARKVFSYEYAQPTKLLSFTTNGNEACKDRGPKWLSLGARSDDDEYAGDVVFRVRRGHAAPSLAEWAETVGWTVDECVLALQEFGFGYNFEDDAIFDAQDGDFGEDLGEVVEDDPVESIEEAIRAAEQGDNTKMETMLAEQEERVPICRVLRTKNAEPYYHFYLDWNNTLCGERIRNQWSHSGDLYEVVQATRDDDYHCKVCIEIIAPDPGVERCSWGVCWKDAEAGHRAHRYKPDSKRAELCEKALGHHPWDDLDACRFCGTPTQDKPRDPDAETTTELRRRSDGWLRNAPKAGLVEECAKAGLKVSGTKKELRERLLEHWQNDK